MKTFLCKLTSRKFLLAISGVIVGIAVALGVDASTVEVVAGAVMSLVSAVTYIITEGKIDANRVKETVEKVQEAVETIQKEGE